MGGHEHPTIKAIYKIVNHDTQAKARKLRQAMDESRAATAAACVQFYNRSPTAPLCNNASTKPYLHIPRVPFPQPRFQPQASTIIAQLPTADELGLQLWDGNECLWLWTWDLGSNECFGCGHVGNIEPMSPILKYPST